MHCLEGVGCMNEFVCLLIFVFCICLTAVVLSGVFANMLVHEWRQAYRRARATEMLGERKACWGKLRRMGPLQKAN